MGEQEPLHGYVNVPPDDATLQDNNDEELEENYELPPLLGRKERSR